MNTEVIGMNTEVFGIEHERHRRTQKHW